MFRGMITDIQEWVREAAGALRRELGLVFSSVGAMLFFFALPLGYPIIYTLIYNPEVVRELPVAVVDNCRTAMSREFVRHADATPAIDICGYAANMQEARRWWNEKKCVAVIEIPADYNEKVVRGETGKIQFYSDVSLLLRYRALLESLTNLQIETDAELRQVAMNTLGVNIDQSMSTVQPQTNFIGVPNQGFASFVMPGIVVLILQQSMLLGICFLAGGSHERRKRHGGTDPLAATGSPSAIVIGKGLCYVFLYLPLTLYILHFVPWFFRLPHQGHIMEYIALIVPMLLATAMLGQTLQAMVHERESAFIVIVFTSVAFLFLSGLTWPRYAMQPFWQWVGDAVPATWGVNGFIRINNNGGTLAQQATDYHALWILTGVYFVTSYLIARFRSSARI